MHLVRWFLKLGADSLGKAAWGWIFVKVAGGGAVITGVVAIMAATLQMPITVFGGFAIFVVAAGALGLASARLRHADHTAAAGGAAALRSTRLRVGLANGSLGVG